MPRPRFVRLRDELLRQRPDIDGERLEQLVRAGHVRVDGRVVLNVDSRVARGCAVILARERPLRGVEKLGHVLDRFVVPVAGRVVLDIGAAAGGFTQALLDRGAARVYSVDAGHGQLLGSLRQDDRVVNLEATNVAELDRVRVPELIEGVSVDVSYLSLTGAVACLDSIAFAAGAWLAGLVKPMFELGRSSLPTSPADFADAVNRAVAGVEAAGWWVKATAESEVKGANGATEFFVIAERA